MRYGMKPTLCILCILVFSYCGSARQPKLLSAEGMTPAVWGFLEAPSGAGPHPAVVILHGAGGWRPLYAELASCLADSGFVALALDYYAEVGPAEIGSAEKIEKWPHYQAAVRSAVEHLEALPSVSAGRIGLVGFSRGAFLAVSVASSLEGVRAVVDFFGGGGGGTDPLEQEVVGLPPVLILHGESDSIVPIRFARSLREAAAASGGEAEIHTYPGVGHAFNLPSAPTYSEGAASDAFRRTVGFLRRRLEG